MKKLLYLSLLLLGFLSACQNDDDPAPGESADARLNQVLNGYKTQLTGAQYGWKAVLYPAGGAGYSFLFNFKENDKIEMSSDINAATAATTMESSFRLKALQKPTLLFDTYSYLHILSDPNATISGGDWGAGKYSDFEFSFESVTSDEIVLKGNLQGSRLVLTRATQAEAATFISSVAAAAASFENINNFITYFKRLTVGNVAFDVSIDSESRFISFRYVEGGTAKVFTTSYYFTPEGISLVDPLTAQGITLNTLTGLQYNAATNRFTFTATGQKGTIQEATRPATVDEQGTLRFFNTLADDYWLSETGFTVNGVEDAFGVRTIPNYGFMVLWPKINGSGSSTFDLLGIVTIDPTTNGAQLDSGPMAVPSLTPDGRIVYTYTRNYESEPKPYDDKLNAIKEQWTDPQGYYVIYTGTNTVDLVSARDAKAWISLEK